jgi:hypothetical protein
MILKKKKKLCCQEKKKGIKENLSAPNSKNKRNKAQMDPYETRR